MLEQRERRTFLTPETWTLCLTGQHNVSQKISTIFPNNSLGMPDFLFYSTRREHIYIGSYRTNLPNHLTQGSPHSLNVLTLGFARRSNKAWMNLKRSSLRIAIYDYISPETTQFIMRWNVAGAFLNPNSLTVHEYNCGFTHELWAVFEVRTCCTLEKPTSDVFTALRVEGRTHDSHLLAGNSLDMSWSLMDAVAHHTGFVQSYSTYVKTKQKEMLNKNTQRTGKGYSKTKTNV